MFTGIVTDVGRVTAIAPLEVGRRLTIATAYPADSVAIGASIACSGVCLTAVDKGTSAEGDWFAADVSGETLDCTTIGGWQEGAAVNLERALTPADELGGHLMLGHVDGVGKVTSIRPEGDNRRVEIEAPAELARFIAAKGSVAVDGVSLTVNEVDANRFGINIIPHTWQHTSFARFADGTPVNLEIDVIARYVARLMETRG